MDESEKQMLVFFGQKIRERRMEIGLSQETLAEKAGLHRNYIGKMERGENNVTFLVLLKLSRALKLSPSELIQWVTEGIIHF